MWKSISRLFSRAGGGSETGDRAANAMLGQLWIALVRLGVTRGLAFHDAEDLAQESIVAGMQAFDPARGNFQTFCKTIMANRAKNLHRDRKPQEPIPEDGGTFRDPDDGPGWASYYRQCREKTDRILAETVSALAEDEARFFFTLAEVHAEQHHGEVSEAARRVGVTPQQGWDIFRKIQRRFADLDRSILLPMRPPERVHDPSTRFSLGDPVPGSFPAIRAISPDSPLPDILLLEGKYLGEFRGRYQRFSAGLRPESLRWLRGILRE